MARLTRMQRAAERLNYHLATNWERSGLAKAKNKPACVSRLDRLEVTADEVSEDLILGIPGTQRTRKHLLQRKPPNKFLPYRRKSEFTTTGSIRQIVVLSEPQMPHIAKFKVTLIARDLIGLQPQDVIGVLELLPGARLVLVEVAFDFGLKSGVDGAYVRAHALFGKSRPNTVACLRGYDSWGTRRGSKFVRSYFK